MIYKSLSAKSLELAKKIQNRELTEAEVLEKLSKRQSLEKDRLALATMANEDREHEQMLKKYTGVKGSKSGVTVMATLLMSRLFGYTFTVKFLEFLQARGQDRYGQLILEIPEAKEAAESNQKHKEILNDMLNSGSMDATAEAAVSVGKMTVLIAAALAAGMLQYKHPIRALLMVLMPGVCFMGVNCLEAYLSAFNARAGAAGKRTVRMLVVQAAALLLLFLPSIVFPGKYILALVLTLIIGILELFASTAYTSIIENSYFTQRFLGYSAALLCAFGILYGGIFAFYKLLG